MVDNVLSQILYGISGFLFSIFAVRNGHKAINRIKEVRAAKGLGLGLILGAFPAILFFIFALVIFPVWFYSRTQIGGFVYLATFIFFNMKGRARP